jgi:hypothetical protein
MKENLVLLIALQVVVSILFLISLRVLSTAIFYLDIIIHKKHKTRYESKYM